MFRIGYSAWDVDRVYHTRKASLEQEFTRLKALFHERRASSLPPHAEESVLRYLDPSKSSVPGDLAEFTLLVVFLQCRLEGGPNKANLETLCQSGLAWSSLQKEDPLVFWTLFKELPEEQRHWVLGHWVAYEKVVPTHHALVMGLFEADLGWGESDIAIQLETFVNALDALQKMAISFERWLLSYDKLSDVPYLDRFPRQLVCRAEDLHRRMDEALKLWGREGPQALKVNKRSSFDQCLMERITAQSSAQQQAELLRELTEDARDMLCSNLDKCSLEPVLCQLATSELGPTFSEPFKRVIHVIFERKAWPHGKAIISAECAASLAKVLPIDLLLVCANGFNEEYQLPILRALAAYRERFEQVFCEGVLKQLGDQEAPSYPLRNLCQAAGTEYSLIKYMGQRLYRASKPNQLISLLEMSDDDRLKLEILRAFGEDNQALSALMKIGLDFINTGEGRLMLPRIGKGLEEVAPNLRCLAASRVKEWPADWGSAKRNMRYLSVQECFGLKSAAETAVAQFRLLSAMTAENKFTKAKFDKVSPELTASWCPVYERNPTTELPKQVISQLDERSLLVLIGFGSMTSLLGAWEREDASWWFGVLNNVAELLRQQKAHNFLSHKAISNLARMCTRGAKHYSAKDPMLSAQYHALEKRLPYLGF